MLLQRATRSAATSAPSAEADRGLLVLHWAGAPAPADLAQAPEGWHIETCQRHLRVARTADRATAANPALERYTGEAAYRFLLEVATGLRSAIPGETNVFGQLRSAWRAFEQQRGAAAAGLAPVVAALFDDTAAVRREHLQGIGGNSYGTLARMLLRPARGERVLLVGTGALAQSIAPAFGTFALGVWGRTAPQAPPLAGARWFAAADAATALQWAQLAIFCIPAATEHDGRWIGLLRDAGPARVAHLGLRRADCGAWAAVPSLRTLDDLFDLQAAQDELRRHRLARARAACAERAGSSWARLARRPADARGGGADRECPKRAGAPRPPGAIAPREGRGCTGT